jgi:phenylpropionate dioxygenase-like ring-hydroxylating dioxygenase large terminal subunit
MWKTPSADKSKPEPGEACRRRYPLNAWYAAGWDYEAGRTPLARTIAGKPMVLYRTASGRPVALADACWHRLAPLSMGKLVDDDQIQCPYHGIRYDGSGRCTFMPAQDTINPSASVTSFPVVDRHRFVWVWPGDPSEADPDLVPDMHWNNDPKWAGDGETMYLKCDYLLALDNLMDLTHEEFVHGDSIGTEISIAGFDSSHTDRTATISRWMYNIEAPPFLAQNLGHVFPDYIGSVDRWQSVRFEAPSAIVIEGGVIKAGSGEDDGTGGEGVSWRVLFAVTPSVDGECHYFWTFVRNYRLSEQSITSSHRETIAVVFEEDREMLEAQQVTIDANPDYDFYNLNIDAGTMWMRRIIAHMVDTEADLGSPAVLPEVKKAVAG